MEHPWLFFFFIPPLSAVPAIMMLIGKIHVMPGDPVLDGYVLLPMMAGLGSGLLGLLISEDIEYNDYYEWGLITLVLTVLMFIINYIRDKRNRVCDQKPAMGSLIARSLIAGGATVVGGMFISVIFNIIGIIPFLKPLSWIMYFINSFGLGANEFFAAFIVYLSMNIAVNNNYAQLICTNERTMALTIMGIVFCLLAFVRPWLEENVISWIPGAGGGIIGKLGKVKKLAKVSKFANRYGARAQKYFNRAQTAYNKYSGRAQQYYNRAQNMYNRAQTTYNRYGDQARGMYNQARSAYSAYAPPTFTPATPSTSASVQPNYGARPNYGAAPASVAQPNYGYPPSTGYASQHGYRR